jgi:hypothetical protein
MTELYKVHDDNDELCETTNLEILRALLNDPTSKKIFFVGNTVHIYVNL